MFGDDRVSTFQNRQPLRPGARADQHAMIGACVGFIQRARFADCASADASANGSAPDQFSTPVGDGVAIEAAARKSGCAATFCRRYGRWQGGGVLIWLRAFLIGIPSVPHSHVRLRKALRGFI
ncbi:hypothetical protein GCM10009113_34520 [Marinobacter szutsaonensis]